MREYDIATFVGFNNLSIGTLLAFALKDPIEAEKDENPHDLMSISLAKMVLQHMRYNELVEWLEKDTQVSYAGFPKTWVLRAAGIPEEDFFKDD